MCTSGKHKVESYEPIQVLKPVAENIWIVDGPIIQFKSVDFPTRMTVIRLSSGGLFIHSPVALNDRLKAQIDELGKVEHLVSPNRIHYWWIGEWSEVYPDAVKWASPDARPAARKYGWDFDHDLQEQPEEAWHQEVDQLIAHGSRLLEEVVFFHKSSRTLILADLIENFEADKVHSPVLRFLMKLGGVLDPDGKLPVDLRLSYFGRKSTLKPAVTRMLEWQPEKVIMSHGRWYESNGTEELKRAFRWVL